MPPLITPADQKHIRKILIRSTNWIGDAVMITPALGAVRATFPGAQIVMVANPLTAPLFSPHPHCDRVMVFDKRGIHSGLGGFLRFCKALRKERFDLALLFQNAIEAAVMAFLAAVPHRAGYGTDGRGWLLTHRVPMGEAQRRLHHTQYYLHMVEVLGVAGGTGTLRLECTQEETEWARATLREGSRWIAVNPGAAYGPAKRWFPERFAALADAMAEKWESRILRVGGSGERELGRRVQETMRGRPLNLIGETTVRQMMALISQCRLLVTNDSGPMHVGAALGIPLVALFGPTDPTVTSPLGGSHRIVRKPVECSPCVSRRCPTDHRCMTAITVEDVLDAVRELMHLHRQAQ